MIGALSIVRFRHPVKNPLELVMYFNLITLGIAASVRTKWAINLTVITILIIFVVRYAHFLYKKYFKKNLFNTSFTEGVEYSTLEIYSQTKKDLIEKSSYLKKVVYDKEDGYIYFLSFEKEEDLTSFKSCLLLIFLFIFIFYHLFLILLVWLSYQPEYVQKTVL